MLSSLLLMAVLAAAANWLLPLGGRRQFAVNITARGAEVSGICIVKTDAEGSRGAIVNEFGIHALDFTLTADRRRLTLQNVMPQMSRWYIKRVVRGDLQRLFTATGAGRLSGRRAISVADDGTVTLSNDKYKLKYSLKEIDEAVE